MLFGSNATTASLIRGVFQTKASFSSGGNKSERVQVSTWLAIPFFQSCVILCDLTTHIVLDCLSHSGRDAYLRVFTRAFFFLLSVHHVASVFSVSSRILFEASGSEAATMTFHLFWAVALRLVVLTFGFPLTPSSWLLLGRLLWMVFWPGFACFCCFAWWTWSTFDCGHCVLNSNV